MISSKKPMMLLQIALKIQVWKRYRITPRYELGPFEISFTI